MEKKPILYIIQGLIGSGKSTFSRKLASEINAIHLNPDEWVINLYSKDEYMKNYDEYFDKTICLLWNKTREYLLSGKDVIFDMGFWYKKDRNFAKMLALECNANLIHYYLNVPDSIIKERIIVNRPQEWAKLHLQNFEKNKKLFEFPENDEDAIIIDNF